MAGLLVERGARPPWERLSRDGPVLRPEGDGGRPPGGSLVTMRLEGAVRMGSLVAEVMGRRGRSDTEAILARWEAMAHGERTAAQRAVRRRFRRQTAPTVVAARR